MTEAKKCGLPLTGKDVALISFTTISGDKIDSLDLKIGVRTVPQTFEIEATCQSLYRLVAIELKVSGITVRHYQSEKE